MFQRQQGQISPKSSKVSPKGQQPTTQIANDAHSVVQRAKADPSSLSADEVLTLQGSIGNRAANQLLAGRSATQVQAKLTIGEPGDKYEQEADRVASQVVEQLHAPASAQLTQEQSVQRMNETPMELQENPKIPLQAEAAWRAEHKNFAHLWNDIEDWMPLDDKVEKLIRNFMMRHDFEYAGSARKFTGTGDCGTLVDEFHDILDYGFGHKGVYRTVHVPGPMLIEAHPIVDNKGKTGNADHGQVWIFVDHYCLEVDGEEIDVLFGQYGRMNAVMGEVRTINGQRRYVFPNNVQYVRNEDINDPSNRYSRVE